MKTQLNNLMLKDFSDADDRILIICYDILKNELKKRKLVNVYLETRKNPLKAGGC